MTPPLWGAIGAAAGVVAAITGGWLFLRRPTLGIENPEEAAAAAEAIGLVVSGAVVGADGAGALAMSADGRVAAVARRGRQLVAREVPWRAVRSTAEGILVETGDTRLRIVSLAGVDVLDIRRLAPKGVRA